VTKNKVGEIIYVENNENTAVSWKRIENQINARSVELEIEMN